jgi:hypothetical protein
MIYLINKERQHNEPSASTSGFSSSKGDNVDAPDGCGRRFSLATI